MVTQTRRRFLPYPPTYGDRRKKKSPRAKSSPQTVPGPPSDPTPRRKLNVDDLDLTRSYVEDWKTAQREKKGPRPERQPRWSSATPLFDREKLPKGWNSDEPDLDPNDIDSQIARCHERIADNIMPHVFQARLKEYETWKAQRRQMTAQEPPGLPFDVYTRIAALKRIQADLQKDGNPYRPLRNLEAVLPAYRRGTLELCEGLVTYWSNGIQLCQPRPFDWDELEAINAKHNDVKGFWTEGMPKSSPRIAHACESIAHGARPWMPNSHHTKLACRLPHCPTWWEELDFTFDTGADVMNMYEDDIRRIMGPLDPQVVGYPPVIATLNIQGIGGWAANYAIEIEVTHIDPESGLRMTPWVKVQTTITPGSFTPESTSRLDAGVLRHLLYMAFAPDGNDMLYLSTNITKLREELPTVNVTDVQDPPAIVRPNPPGSTPISLHVAPPTFTAGPKAPVFAMKGVRN